MSPQLKSSAELSGIEQFLQRLLPNSWTKHFRMVLIKGSKLSSNLVTVIAGARQMACLKERKVLLKRGCMLKVWLIAMLT